MMHEVRSIPPAPRRVRLRPLLAHRWPLLALGGTMATTGGLLAWLMFLQAGGKPAEDHRLDVGPTTVARGRVLALDEPVQRAGDRWQRINYTFAGPQGDLPGSSSAPAGRFVVDQEVTVELLPHEPNVNRIKGTVRHVAIPWLQPESWFAGLCLPGALVLLGWLAGAFQLRHVLVHGDVSVGKVTAIKAVPHVLPEMLRVSYEFRDHRATLRSSSHWVRAHGELGARLVHQMHTGWFEPMPVLHDRRLPQWNRLLLPQDFLQQANEGPVEAERPS